MKKHFVIVTGYPDKKYKEDLLINLSQKIRKTVDNITLCYCTHYPQINTEIYDIFDYVFYNKKNPILNWDIIDKFTRTFGCQLNTEKFALLFFQPYHGYAHHLSICDGLEIGIANGHETFSILNYDCIDFCVEQLPTHINEIIKNPDNCIFYEYGGHEREREKDLGDVNTEFFTINLKMAKLIVNIREYKKFSGVFKYMMYEKIIHELIKINDINVTTKKFNTKNKALGTVSYAYDVTHDNYNDKFFAPFYEKWIENKRYCYYFLPFIGDDEKRYFTIVDNTEGKMNCRAEINGMRLDDYASGTFFEMKEPHYFLKVYEDDELKVNLKIHDDRQHAICAKFKE